MHGGDLAPVCGSSLFICEDRYIKIYKRQYNPSQNCVNRLLPEEGVVLNSATTVIDSLSEKLTF